DDHLRGTPSQHPRRRRGRGPGARTGRHRGALQLRPRPHPAHAVRGLGPNRRARTHRQVAEALEDLCGDRPGSRIGELARHWSSTARHGDLAKAISYSRRAGDAALSSLAPGDALGYYTQALELLRQTDDLDPVPGIDLAIGLGTAQRQTGDPGFR